MIPRDVAERVADLAGLDLGPDGIETARVELNRILEFVEALNALDLPDLSPGDLHGGLKAPLREDRVRVFPFQDVLSQAPSLRGGHYEVPMVIPEKGDDSSDG